MKDGYDLTGKPIPEKAIQDSIREALAYSCVVFRANVGTFKSGNRFVNTGLPKGFPDLFGFRKSDGRFFAIEVKNVRGRLSDDQKRIGEMLKDMGAIYGVARSVADALRIVGE